MKIEMTNKDGVTLLTAGKYCTENIEVTPTFEMGGGGTGGSAEIITKYAYSGGTAVPNTGTIENIYWNTLLSMDEINTLISNANLTWAELEGIPVYPIYAVLVDGAPTSLVMILNGEAVGSSGYVIMDFIAQTIFLVSSEELGAIMELPSGWDATLISNQGIVAVNGELQSSFADMGFGSVGAENDKLINLFSASQYTKTATETMPLSGTYESVTLSITVNGETDVKELIETDKKIPFNIRVHVPNLFAQRIDGTLSEISSEELKGITLGEYAFAGCQIESITIPDTMVGRAIPIGAFKRCISLTHIVIPEGVTGIENEAFSDSCWGNVNIHIPASVTYIGSLAQPDLDGAFEGSHINSVSFEKGSQLTEIRDRAFMRCGYLHSFEFPENLNTIGEKAFQSCSALRSATFNSKLSSIGYQAFYYNQLRFVRIPYTNTLTISKNVFYENGVAATIFYCENGTKPANWEEGWNRTCPVIWDCNNNDVADDGYIYTIIDNIAFSIKDNSAGFWKQPGWVLSSSNRDYSIPETINYNGAQYSVTTIRMYACSALFLDVLRFPKTIQIIETQAFNSGPVHQNWIDVFDFRNLENVPTLGRSAFNGNLKDTMKIVVPDALYDEWIVATNWSNYASHIVKASEYTE